MKIHRIMLCNISKIYSYIINITNSPSPIHETTQYKQNKIKKIKKEI